MKKVIIIQEFIAHYRKPFFELLNKSLKEDGINLELVTSPLSSNNLIEGKMEWAKVVPIMRFGKLALQNVFPFISSADLIITQQGSRYPINLLIQAITRLGGRTRFALWGHGKNFQFDTADYFGEKFKLFYSRHCDWWFAYNQISVSALSRLDFPIERITDVQNAIDTKWLRKEAQQVSQAELDELRSKLGLKSDNVAIFCGGMYRHKRLSFLLDCCYRIRKEIHDFEVIFIGAGEDEEMIRCADRHEQWIHYVGRLSGPERVRHWLLAKVLLMPGLVGLVILDSFALGVPIITTNYPCHSPEIAYLEHNKNGLMVRPWTDPHAYSQAVIKTLRNPVLLAELRNYCLQSAENYTIEEMVRRFSDGIKLALGCPKFKSLFC